jgi:segregation and condensation protein B
MDQLQIKKILEALIFASDGPATMGQFQTILENVDKNEIENGLEAIRNDLQDRAIFLKKVGGGYEFATRPEYSKWLQQLLDFKLNTRLSRAALEVLAIIAFKQPISKVEVSAIRGVNSDGVMKTLLERRLVTISGRDSGPGRPLLFVTTKEFLHYFSLDNVKDLPRPKEIDELLAEGEAGKLLSDASDNISLPDVGQDKAALEQIENNKKIENDDDETE